MVTGCPGSSAITSTPTLKIKTCPECGSELEIFSCDIKVNCEKCDFVAYNDIISCISWCSYARQCVGDEVYEMFMSRKEEVAKAAEENIVMI